VGYLAIDANVDLPERLRLGSITAEQGCCPEQPLITLSRPPGGTNCGTVAPIGTHIRERAP
jgi:hypothetical protein